MPPYFSKDILSLVSVGHVVNNNSMVYLNINVATFLRRDILMSMIFIVIPFLPSSNLFFKVGFLIAERVLYIPSIGQALLFGSICGRSWNQYRHIYIKYLFWCICLTFALRTSIRNRDWSSEDSFWKSVITVNPNNAKAHFLTMATFCFQMVEFLKV